MTDEFSLARSRWYNETSIVRASRWVRDDAESLSKYALALTAHPHNKEIDIALCDAETALTEALLAVSLARSAYQKKRLLIQECA